MQQLVHSRDDNDKIRIPSVLSALNSSRISEKKKEEVERSTNLFKYILKLGQTKLWLFKSIIKQENTKEFFVLLFFFTPT